VAPAARRDFQVSPSQRSQSGLKPRSLTDGRDRLVKAEAQIGVETPTPAHIRLDAAAQPFGLVFVLILLVSRLDRFEDAHPNHVPGGG